MIDESRIRRVAEEKIGPRLTQDGMLFADCSQDELVEFARAIEQLVTDELAARVPPLPVRSNAGLEGTCKKCGGAMKHGKAIEQTWVGTPEWPGEWRGVTMSPGGTGKLIDCAKCEKCGWSMTSNV